MKVLSIKQPWASAIVYGLKDVENRNWQTSYRGPILIHSSKEGLDIGQIEDKRFPLVMDVVHNFDEKKAAYIKESPYYKLDGEELIPIREFTDIEKREEDFLCDNYKGLPFSAIVGIANIVDIVRNSSSPWAEPNCYHWILSDCRPFSLPERRINGRLRLWEYPIEKLNKTAQKELSRWR